ncbi:hypothetical protein AAMO2058_000311900 [Amorphochlora amoebiformis]
MGSSPSGPQDAKPKRQLKPPGSQLDVNEGTFGPHGDPDIDFGPDQPTAHYLFHPKSKDSKSLYMPEEKKSVEETCKKLDTFLGYMQYDIAPPMEDLIKDLKTIYKNSVRNQQNEETSTSLDPRDIKAYNNGKTAEKIMGLQNKCRKGFNMYQELREEVSKGQDICENNGFRFACDTNGMLDPDTNRVEECRKLFGRHVMFTNTIKQNYESGGKGCSLVSILYDQITGLSQ